MAERRAAMRKMAHVLSEQHEEKILRQIAKERGIGYLPCGCEEKHLTWLCDAECECGNCDWYCSACYTYDFNAGPGRARLIRH
jgi:hypothetical protein